MHSAIRRGSPRARVGDGNVVDIEREVELGGPIHSKGVLILAGLLGSRYARRLPLSLSASIVFEQSYGDVEGDSASLAELCALLSTIAEVPIKQSFAVTGSVNQHGDLQPMLRHDVVAAVAEGKFRIHAATTVDEALELVTGVVAGVREPCRRSMRPPRTILEDLRSDCVPRE